MLFFGTYCWCLLLARITSLLWSKRYDCCCLVLQLAALAFVFLLLFLSLTVTLTVTTDSWQVTNTSQLAGNEYILRGFMEPQTALTLLLRALRAGARSLDALSQSDDGASGLQGAGEVLIAVAGLTPPNHPPRLTLPEPPPHPTHTPSPPHRRRPGGFAAGAGGLGCGRPAYGLGLGRGSCVRASAAPRPQPSAVAGVQPEPEP